MRRNVTWGNLSRKGRLENLEANGKNTGITVNIQEVGCIFVNWMVRAKNREKWRDVKGILMKHGAQ